MISLSLHASRGDFFPLRACHIDLWKALDDLNNIHKIKWIKVKGHADNVYNNRCDELARMETAKFM